MNFLKTFLASILGTIIGITLIFLIFLTILITSAGEPEPHIRSNTVLEINLSGQLTDRTEHDPFRELFDGPGADKLSLERLKSNLEKAATDDRIAGIRLNVNRVWSSWANLETAYGYLSEFKENSGKFVYASTDDLGMNETGWFLASVADSIFSPPETNFEFDGFVIQLSYYKNMLNKIGIDPEIQRVGSYKSTVEPFLREESSPENREQIMSILNSASSTFISAAEKRTGLSANEINSLMNEIPENSVEWGHRNGLIDVIAHPHEVKNAIRARLGLDEDESPRKVSMARYNRVKQSSAGVDEPATNDRISVIYASGMIMPQAPGSPFMTGSVMTADAIQKSLSSSLDDDNVKAIVVHINSGGGAVSTSELIWSHIRQAAEEKPVIAYLGSVAASGGYYIAMGADSVIASPNTITGSIGIYNQLFNTQELYNDKLGINFETFKTHDHSDMWHMVRPLTPGERRALQRNLENSYETFLQRVSDNRNMSRDEVHEIAQGRVWTGRDALEINLVDQLGSLDDAVDIAAEKAGIVEYGVVTYPERKELFEILFHSAETRMAGWVRSFIPFSEEIQTLEQLQDHNIGRNWAIMPIRFTVE